jgi:CxxC motif-containing protein (DUF1111 family)
MSRAATSLIGMALAAIASLGLADPTFDRDEEKPGGETTVYATGQNAFSFPAANLDEAGRTRFAIGNSFFRRNWVEAPSSTSARDGLGPHFIARSCGGCHLQGGRGPTPALRNRLGAEQPVALLIRLSVPGEGSHGEPKPEPTYGNQFNNAAVQGVKANGKVMVSYAEVAGRFADGQSYTLRVPRYRLTDVGYGPLDAHTMLSPRLAPQLIGVGLIEAIPESAIRANVEEQAKRPDAIKGVANLVWDVYAEQSLIGRFGWKANVATLAHQTANAFQADIGITSSRFPQETCTAKQIDCLAAPRGNKGEQPEIDDHTLADVIFNQATLAPPARRGLDDPKVRRGQALFREAQCAVCHHPGYVTGEPPFAAFSSPVLAGQKIFPYTDLLLHDMGDRLADGRPDFKASGRQWKTPPLWGIGLIGEVNGGTFLLHDGRARSVLVAILWHGGEAQASRQQVLKMNREARQALVKFVESL